MKYEDFLSKIEKDPEYVAAREALRLRFALGNAVIFARMKRGWSQTELARRVGTKQANISRIESAIANPTLDLIKKIVDVLELDIHITPRPATTTSAKIIYQQVEQNGALIPWPADWTKPSETTSSQSVWSIRK